MANYRLTYMDPYEFDDDSPSGIGDHDIWWGKESTVFEAQTDEEARKLVGEFVTKEIMILGQSLHRKPIELVRIV